MKKRKSLSIVCLLGMIFFLAGCSGLSASTPKERQSQEERSEQAERLEDGTKQEEEAVEDKQNIRITAIPEGASEFTGAVVMADGKKIPLYEVMVNTSQMWNGNTETREPAGVGYLELEGSTRITVTLPYEIDYSSKVRPLAAGIIPVADIENRTFSFEIDTPGTYIIEPNGDYGRAIHLFVSGFADAFVQDENVIYFGKGVHTAQNNPLIRPDNTIVLTSGMTVYLEAGAVVRAKFVAHNAKDITIKGRGIIDGSQFARNAYTGEVTVPLDFSDCSNVLLKDFSVLDPAGWCVNFYFLEDSRIENLKIITSRSNGDGISIQSCKNITVSGCFVRSWDDSLVVKNYPRWSNRSIQGETENIMFENCILWTDLAQSMEIGYETVGSKMENIVFRDITVLHALHRAPISIHNANNADISNVLYESIIIEDASMTQGDTKGGNPVIEFTVEYSPTWSDQHTTTGLGSISDVTVKGLTVLSGSKNISIGISGCKDMREDFQDEHWIKNIHLEDIKIKGKLWDSETANLQCNPYTEEITIFPGGKE